MKKIKGLYIGIAVIGLMALCGTAQGQYNIYNTAAGVRIGGTSGFAIKHQYRPSRFVEGIIGGFPNGFSITGLIEKSLPAFNEPGFYWYYGAGAHVSAYNGRSNGYNRFGREIDYRASSDIGFGVDGIIGLEYRLPDNVPVAFSLDVKPFVEVSTGGNVGVAMDPSVGVKFIFR